MYKLELIWHLVEILFMDSSPGGLVMPHLLNWVSLHFPACEERARYLLVLHNQSVKDLSLLPTNHLFRSVLSQGSDSPEQHGDYWEAVTQFVLQGRVDQARNLLRLHSEFTTDPFTSLDELLRKMPVCNAASSAAQFEFTWRAWQVEVRTFSF